MVIFYGRAFLPEQYDLWVLVTYSSLPLMYSFMITCLTLSTCNDNYVHVCILGSWLGFRLDPGSQAICNCMLAM